MEVIGWIMAVLLGLFVGAAWIILIFELIGLPVAAALSGLGRYLERRRHRHEAVEGPVVVPPETPPPH